VQAYKAINFVRVFQQQVVYSPFLPVAPGQVKRGGMEGKPMIEQAKEHKIMARLNIDGEEYAKGIILSPEQVIGPDGTIRPEGRKQQKKLVEFLTRAMEITIKTELGKQGEPAFIEYAPKGCEEDATTKQPKK